MLIRDDTINITIFRSFKESSSANDTMITIYVLVSQINTKFFSQVSPVNIIEKSIQHFIHLFFSAVIKFYSKLRLEQQKIEHLFREFKFNHYKTRTNTQLTRRLHFCTIHLSDISRNASHKEDHQIIVKVYQQVVFDILK